MSNPYETAKQKQASVLGPTLKFKGELSADEDLLIQGQIEGTIKHKSSLTIGEEGRVRASVSAEVITVEGNVEGDLNGATSVAVRESAEVQGNIVSPSVSLFEGATFNGTIDMTGEGVALKQPEEKAKSETVDVEEVEKPAKVKSASQRKSGKNEKQADVA